MCSSDLHRSVAVDHDLYLVAGGDVYFHQEQGAPGECLFRYALDFFCIYHNSRCLCLPGRPAVGVLKCGVLRRFAGRSGERSVFTSSPITKFGDSRPQIRAFRYRLTGANITQYI